MDNNQLSEKEIRIKKINKIKSLSVNPYAQGFQKNHNISDIKKYENKKFRNLDNIIKTPENNFQTAGRLMLYRSHGKIAFGRILDNTDQIQIMFHKSNCKIDISKNKEKNNIVKELNNGEISSFKFVEKYIDVGDYIGIRGELFKTQKGELTIFVKEFKLLSKAIRPLPEKFHGIKDLEACYRKRYLDLIMNNDTYERFLFKSKFYQILREFYTKNGFIELETSILGNSASGAAAQPFITHHNDFGCDFYLRIAFETALKKATVGRFEKVFEIGRDFRNEGSDPSHLQEFTQVEHYAVYRNYEDNMKFSEKLLDFIFDSLKLNRKVKVKNKEGIEKIVNFKTPFDRIDYVKGVNEASGIDITKYGINDADKLRNDIKSKGIEFEGMDTMGTTSLIDYLYKKVLRPNILGPAFVYNYPKIMQPLARISDTNKNIVEQFQLLVNGREICKAYSELVDPQLQQENFDEQSIALKAGDEEATSEDKDFVNAMEYGMPPQSGFGMGLERIISILTNQDNLRDVVLFPIMKPNSNSTNDHPSIQDNKVGQENEETNYENIPSISDANNLVDKYLNETKLHCQQVAKVMKHFSKKLNQNEDLRYITGLLHDIDRDHINKTSDLHLKEEFDKIVSEIDLPENIKNDIKAHGYWLTDINPETLLAKYLISVDELVGFLYAYSLMRPEGFEGIKYSSIKKKLKDKKFAAGIDREQIKNCEKFLNIPLEQFVMEVLEGLK